LYLPWLPWVIRHKQDHFYLYPYDQDIVGMDCFDAKCRCR
jgi:hypothetical protein